MERFHGDNILKSGDKLGAEEVLPSLLVLLREAPAARTVIVTNIFSNSGKMGDVDSFDQMMSAKTLGSHCSMGVKCPNYESRLKILQVTGEQPTELMRCARCRTAAYCSAECQKADWKGGHNAACQPADAQISATAKVQSGSSDGSAEKSTPLTTEEYNAFVFNTNELLNNAAALLGVQAYAWGREAWAIESKRGRASVARHSFPPAIVIEIENEVAATGFERPFAYRVLPWQIRLDADASPMDTTARPLDLPYARDLEVHRWLHANTHHMPMALSFLQYWYKGRLPGMPKPTADELLKAEQLSTGEVFYAAIVTKDRRYLRLVQVKHGIDRPSLQRMFDDEEVFVAKKAIMRHTGCWWWNRQLARSSRRT